MKKSRFTESQIVGVLNQVDAGAAIPQPEIRVNSALGVQEPVYSQGGYQRLLYGVLQLAKTSCSHRWRFTRRGRKTA